MVHICFAFLLWLCILAFDALTNDSLINVILTLAGYTYGPLLGLFGFGLILPKRQPIPWSIPIIALISVASPRYSPMSWLPCGGIPQDLNSYLSTDALPLLDYGFPLYCTLQTRNCPFAGSSA
jgi:hypothetical protein